jgi:hypothetical protein
MAIMSTTLLIARLTFVVAIVIARLRRDRACHQRDGQRCGKDSADCNTALTFHEALLLETVASPHCGLTIGEFS